MKQPWCFLDVIVFFAMAKIQRICYDHQAPFWNLLLLLDGNQLVTPGKNKLPHAQFTSKTDDFYLQILKAL